MEIVEFLRARLDEDARQEWHRGDTPRACAVVSLSYYEGECDCGGPARVLREIEAKRQIVDLHQIGHECAGLQDNEPYGFIYYPYSDIEPCSTLRLLASVWSEHPDYDETWRRVGGGTSPS